MSIAQVQVPGHRRCHLNMFVSILTVQDLGSLLDACQDQDIRSEGSCLVRNGRDEGNSSPFVFVGTFHNQGKCVPVPMAESSE